MEYKESLNACRKSYPFDYWLEDYVEGIGRYNQENCDMVKSVFDGLVDSLIELGVESSRQEKEKLFEVAVKRLNSISSSTPKLIETIEREEFCDLFNEVSVASGLDPESYADGEGIASLWRNW